MISITKTEDALEYGLLHRRIEGLNVFAANGLAVPALADPRLVFLMALSSRVPCSVHVGSLALKDLVDAPEGLFGPPRADLPYARTRVGFSDGFYDLDAYPCWDACFFPQVTPAFWEARLPEAERRDEDDWQGLDYLIAAHGLALYVGATPQALKAMATLLDAPFPGHGEWLRQATRLYPLVLTTGHDGDYFHAYTQDAAAFTVLEPALKKAVEAIRVSAWFQEHERVLDWDEQFNLCLMVRS